MTVNRFFDHIDFEQTQEQDLLQCLIDESIQIHGLDMYYIPRTLVNEDYLFGEDTISNYNAAVLIEMYLETFDDWQGEGNILSKFGLVVAQSATFIVSKKRFEEELTEQFAAVLEPEIGDLVYYPRTDALFEIKSVKEENPFYQIGDNYTYKLDIEKFSYSYEDVDTGISQIDDIEIQYANPDDAGNSQADNDQIETEADGSATDAFDDTGTNDRGNGVIDFSEDDPFGSY